MASPTRGLLAATTLAAGILPVIIDTTTTGNAAGNAARQSTTEVKMEQVGKAFVFDYGQFVVKVQYLSDRKLAWEQVKGPDVGLKAEAAYGCARIRPNVYFIWWQEKDTSVVAQVVDFQMRLVYTTWISPEKKIASFQGSVTPIEK